MANIKVKFDVLDGNIGEGWKDNFVAARAYGNLLELRWAQDLSHLDAEVEVEVGVCVLTCGTSARPSVFVTRVAADEDEYALRQEVERSLTDYNEVFAEFCGSARAEDLAA